MSPVPWLGPSPSPWKWFSVALGIAFWVFVFTLWVILPFSFYVCKRINLPIWFLSVEIWESNFSFPFGLSLCLLFNFFKNLWASCVSNYNPLRQKPHLHGIIITHHSLLWAECLGAVGWLKLLRSLLSNWKGLFGTLLRFLKIWLSSRGGLRGIPLWFLETLLGTHLNVLEFSPRCFGATLDIFALWSCFICRALDLIFVWKHL